MENIGQTIPDWILDENWDNAIKTPDELRGSWTVLLFFNIKCPGCTGRAIPYLKKLIEEYPSIKAVTIHTDFKSTTPLDRLQRAVDYLALPFPVLRDKEDETYKQYGAEGTPHWFIIDEKGIVQKSIFGSMGTALQRIDYTLKENMIDMAQ